MRVERQAETALRVTGQIDPPMCVARVASCTYLYDASVRFHPVSPALRPEKMEDPLANQVPLSKTDADFTCLEPLLP